MKMARNDNLRQRSSYPPVLFFHSNQLTNRSAHQTIHPAIYCSNSFDPTQRQGNVYVYITIIVIVVIVIVVVVIDRIRVPFYPFSFFVKASGIPSTTS